MKLSKILITVLAVALILGFTVVAGAEEYVGPPSLEEEVEAGELPPVEDRLPDDPMVVEPLESIGQHGGTWYTAHTGSLPFVINGYDPLLRWDDPKMRDEEGESRLLPNLATDWEIKNDGKEYIIHLRQGVKWSDGDPFDADDIMFWWNNIIMNDDLRPAKPTWMKVRGELGNIEKIDKYTLRFTFSDVHGSFLQCLAAVNAGQALTRFPEHYLSQFHIDLVDDKDALKEEVKEEGYDKWFELFESKADWMANPELPVLTAWVLANKPSASGGSYIGVRNKYYWKVDPEGNQLPYIDQTVTRHVESTTAILLKAIAGEIDWQYHQIGGIKDAPQLKKNEERGGYTLGTNTAFDQMAGHAMILNQTVEDEVLREIFRNKKFRHAISHAINREEIIAAVYAGNASPKQPTPLPGSYYYSPEFEEYEKRYIEFKPEKANELLNEIGLEWDKNNEYRLRPDGKPLTLHVVHSHDPEHWRVKSLELTRYQLKEVGIKVEPRIIEQSALFDKVQANEWEVTWTFVSGGFNPVLAPTLYPVKDRWPQWCLGSKYVDWYLSDGERGIEPTGDMKKLVEIYEDAVATVDREEKRKLVAEAVDLHTENLWRIGMVHKYENQVISNRMHNAPIHSGRTNDYWTGPAYPEQFYISE